MMSLLGAGRTLERPHLKALNAAARGNVLCRRAALLLLALSAAFLAGLALPRAPLPLDTCTSPPQTALDSIRSQAAAALLPHCDSLECLRAVHGLSSPQSRFNFPHFMIVGYRKSATTSLYKHLLKHPQVRGPSTKEPHFFTGLCRHSPWRCPPKHNEEPFYVRTVLGAQHGSNASFDFASFEASADYTELLEDGSSVARAVREALPWVRVVAALREPISRAISWQNSLASRAETQRVACLRRGGATLFKCLQRHFDGGLVNYSYPLLQWIEAFPKEQLFIIQYENLTGSLEGDVLKDLYAFLGIDPLPSVAGGAEQLRNPNNRKKDRPEGWPLTREEYEHLISVVRSDAERLADILDKYGLGDGAAWVAAWEAAWAQNLQSNCADGQCQIHVT